MTLTPVGKNCMCAEHSTVPGGVKLPKNGRVRTVVAAPYVVAAIAAVPPTLNDDLIFPHGPGSPSPRSPRCSTCGSQSAAAWEATGHRHIDAYELRHAAATMLLERGVSISDVALQLGHTDGGLLVAKRYGHPDENLGRDRLKMWRLPPG